MRLCFLGDSHLGAIRSAWVSSRADATFFALPGKGMAHLEVHDGALLSHQPKAAEILFRISGGKDRIDGNYGTYVLHGMHLGMAETLSTLRDMRDLGAPVKLVGTPDFRTALRKAIEDSLALNTLRKLRQISDAPAIVSPTPLMDAQFMGLRNRLVEFSVAGQLASLFIEECGDVCQGLGAEFVPQPPETLAADGLATRPEYTEGAARFSARAAEGDNVHMNAQYGAAVIERVMAAL